jgi:hypothetical protein
MTLLSDVQIKHHQNLWGNGRELSSPQKKSKNVLLGKSIDALSGYPHVYCSLQSILGIVDPCGSCS